MIIKEDVIDFSRLINKDGMDEYECEIIVDKDKRKEKARNHYKEWTKARHVNLDERKKLEKRI